MTGFAILTAVQTVALLSLCWRRDRFGAPQPNRHRKDS
jgi:hypothetical protein